MSSNDYMEVLKDLQEAITKTDEIRQVNRASPLKDHLAMVADGVGALGWITFESNPKPAEYVAELFGGAQIFGNKVLKEFKEKFVAPIYTYPLDCMLTAGPGMLLKSDGCKDTTKSLNHYRHTLSSST